MASLHLFQLPLHQPEELFDLFPYFGDKPFNVLIEGMQLAYPAHRANKVPDVARSRVCLLAPGAGVALVRSKRDLVAMKLFVPDLIVVNLRGRCLEAINDTAVGVHADVCLHAEIPIVALPGRGDLGIACAGLVLGRGRGVDDHCIQQRARAQRDPLIGQMRVHLGEGRLGQHVPLQQVAEVEDRCLIGNQIVADLDPSEQAHRFAVIKRHLDNRVAQRIPVLKKVYRQHRLQRHRWTATLRLTIG